jgi:hypothetical protein
MFNFMNPHKTIRLTSIKAIWMIAIIILLLCFLMEKDLIEAHIDGTAYWFSSDGPQYYQMYLSYLDLNYFDSDFIRFSNPLLYVLIGVGLPSLTLWLTNGGMWLTNLFNILFLFWGLSALLESLPVNNNTVGAIRWKFLGYFMLFPYVLPGIISINKEIFCLASALFFSAYFLNGDRKYLFLTLFSAFLSRYFLVVVYLVVVVAISCSDIINRRWFNRSLVICALIFSLVVPALFSIDYPGYSIEANIDTYGTANNYFISLQNIGLYFLVYPLKLFALASSKLFNFIKGTLDFSNRPADYMELFVSVYSVIIITMAGWLLATSKLNDISRRFIWLGFLSPYVLAWVPTYHWRYYIFSVVFLLVGILLRKYPCIDISQGRT